MQPVLFEFGRHLESMMIDWYHKVMRLDPRLLVMKFCFQFCYMYFTKSFLHKKASHWRWKTRLHNLLMQINYLFASVGCENVQMAQKRALEWTLRINDGYSTMSDGITSRGEGGEGTSNTRRFASCYGNRYTCKLRPCGPLACVRLLTLTLHYQVGGGGCFY